MQSESLDLCKADQFSTYFDYTCSIVYGSLLKC